MDNGMIANMPAYFIETVELSDAGGAPLARLALSEAVAPNPTLTLLIDHVADDGRILIRARDNNGGDFRGEVSRPASAKPVRQGSLK